MSDKDDIARAQSVGVGSNWAAVVNLFYILAFWIAAHSITTNWAAVMWIGFVLSVVSLIVVVLTNVIANAFVKAMLAKEKLTDNK